MTDWVERIDSLIADVGRGVRHVSRAVGSAFDKDPFELLAYY